MDNLEGVVARATQGDKEAFAKLYDEYIKKIYNFIYYKTHHKETAEDLTSITFTKAWKNIESFNKGSIQAWLYTIARNTVIDHYRTVKQDKNIDDVWDLSSNTDIAMDADTVLKVEDVKKYLQDIAPIQRDIVIMRVWQDLSYKEIAEITGKSEANCKVIYSRAISKLKLKMPIVVFIAFLFLK